MKFDVSSRFRLPPSFVDQAHFLDDDIILLSLILMATYLADLMDISASLTELQNTRPSCIGQNLVSTSGKSVDWSLLQNGSDRIHGQTIQPSVIKCTKNAHTHAPHHVGATSQKREGLALSVASADASPCRTTPLVSEPPHSSPHVRKHNEDQSYALVYGGLRLVSSKGREEWSCGSLTWLWSSPYSTTSYK